MLRSVEVKDYMLPNPVKVNADADISEAIELILEYRISGLSVVDDENNLVGVLSELDCLQAILTATYNQRTSVGTVREHMTGDVISADAKDDILSVASDMLKNKHRRRPVVENGKLVGQISCRQLLKAVREFSSHSEAALPQR